MHPFFRRVSPLSFVVVPIKQHLGCCVILPLLLKLLAATAFAEVLQRMPHTELLLGMLILPLVVYACLKIEDAWKARAHRKKSACQMSCCPPRPTRKQFMQRFLTNLLIGCVLIGLVHYLHHDRPHAQPAQSILQQ